MLELHQNPKWAPLLTGPNGRTIREDFPIPPGVHKGKVCAATGHQATDGFESRAEWLVDGEGPSLRCDQLSAYEFDQLQGALDDLRQNGGKYSGRGPDSIYRYASTVNISRGSGPSEGGSPLIVPRGGDGG